MGNKDKILVVEDNRETQLIIKAALRNNFDVQVESSASSALTALSKTNFDAILLDLNLSGDGDGKSILKEIRDGMKNHKVPVIITTAYDLNAEDKNFFDQNANAFLLKPLNKETLLKSISNLLPNS